MKTLVILAVLAAFSYAKPTSHGDNGNYDIIDSILNEGYPVQNITVTTRDGYILDIIRIPGPRAELEQWSASEKKSTGKIIVLLMPGLIGSADEFVVGGHHHGLAYKLANRGFDVFMGNVRGSKYGRKHTRLNPDRSKAFWQYTWDQIGEIDVPAIIERITRFTGEKKMHYIGYNEGSTAFFVTASKLPQYNSRIRKVIALGPMVYMQQAHHPLMSKIRANLRNPSWIRKHIGENEFDPTQELKDQVEPDCIAKKIDYQVCNNFYFLVNGYSNNFNQTIVPDLRAGKPYGISVRQLLHYAEILNTDQFSSYSPSYAKDDTKSDSDSSDSSSEEGYVSSNGLGSPYDLKAVTAPTHLLYVAKDPWSGRQDVDMLANALPNAQESYDFSDYQANVDLILAKDSHNKVHNKILNILQ